MNPVSVSYGVAYQTNAAAVALVEYPTPNDASQALILIVSVVGFNGAPATVPTPAGWTLIGSGTFRDDGLGDGPLATVALFYRIGGSLSGSISVPITCSDIYSATIAILQLDETRSSSPYDGPSNTETPFDFIPPINEDHIAGSITKSVVNELLIGVWAGIPQGSLSVQSFLNPGPMQTQLDVAYESNVSIAMMLCVESGGGTGSTGARTVQDSGYGQFSASMASRQFLLAWKPYNGPSLSEILYPNGGESLMVGASVTLTCSAATHQTVAQSALQYEFSYSTNNGSTWTVIGLSAAGVTSKAWTVPNVIGTGNKIRVRAFDGTLYSVLYDQSDAAFSIVAETAPAAPSITVPSGIQNKATPVVHTYSAGTTTGNPVTESTWLWSRDNFATHTSSPIVVSGSFQSTSIDYSGEASGTTISVKVKRKGVTLYSAYSAVRSFIVATLPATPNITAPTAGSPPSEPYPTFTFTEADSFVARRLRTAAGYDSGEVNSAATSFESPVAFSNGVSATVFLSVKNSFGLWSAEDSETFTPVYTGPAQPSLSLTGSPEQGYIQALIENSDTPDYNELWRYPFGEGLSAAVKVGALLPVDGRFSDYNVASGIQYVYFVRAYTSGLFTNSEVSDAISITLQ